MIIERLERMGFVEEGIIWRLEEEEEMIEIVGGKYMRVEEYDRMDGVTIKWFEFRNMVEMVNHLEGYRGIENED